MALFSPNEQTNGKDVETIIGPSVKVEGNFKGEGNVYVEGVVQGTLKTNHNLKVGPQARIKAEVEAENLILAGEIRGNVIVKGKTELAPTAKIIGNLETKLLSVEEGAIINGKCIMLPEHAAAEQEIKKVSK
jgi:cytoskeletal protein CcmA (bactofilin family)